MPLFLFLCCGISTECEHMVFTTSIVCSTTTHTSAGGDPYFSAFGYLSFSWMGQCDKVVFKISEQRYFIFSFGNLWRYCIAVLHPEVKRVPQMQRNTFRLLVSFLCYKIRISLNLGFALFHGRDIATRYCRGFQNKNISFSCSEIDENTVSQYPVLNKMWPLNEEKYILSPFFVGTSKVQVDSLFLGYSNTTGYCRRFQNKIHFGFLSKILWEYCITVLHPREKREHQGQRNVNFPFHLHLLQ